MSEKALTKTDRPRAILVTGGTGYLGRALIPKLLARRHAVRALIRPGAQAKLPAGVEAIEGDPLDSRAVEAALREVDTVVHLVGVAKPSPAKAREFRRVDLVSIQALMTALTRTNSRPHVIYLSVAQPAPVMKAYVEVRREGEALIRASGVPATFLRPWYVLGPGHRWPVVLKPVYALLRWFPITRASAERLDFVTLSQMVAALVATVEARPVGVRVVDVPGIKSVQSLP